MEQEKTLPVEGQGGGFNSPSILPDKSWLADLKHPLVDREQALLFIACLGKNTSTTRMRGFFPTGHPRKNTDSGVKDRASHELATKWQQEGRGVYIVINEGGDKDSDITRCVALFAEWDDRSVEWQITAWQELGLPEPSLMVTTGGKSVHVYWVFAEPISVELWRDLQKRLLEYCDADRTLKNPSRVMRLPGAWHLGPDGTPNGQTAIIHTSDHRYTPEDFQALLPPIEVVKQQDAARNFRIPSDHFKRSLSDISAALNRIPAAVPNQKQYAFYRNLLWGLIRACEEIGATSADALQLMKRHSPLFAEVDQVAASTFTSVTAGSFWYHAKEHGYQHSGSTEHTKKATRNWANIDTTNIDAEEETPDEVIERLVNELLDLRLTNTDTWAKEMHVIASLTRGHSIPRADVERRNLEALANRWKLSITQSHTGIRTNRSCLVSEDTEEQQMLVHGFLPWKRDALVFGPGGVGKTTASVALAWSVISGVPFLDHQIQGDITGKVLWIGTDGGDGAYAMWRNTAQDLGIAEDPRWIEGCVFWGSEATNNVGSWACTPAGLYELKTELEKGGYALVIIDSWKAVLELAGIDFGIGPVGTVVRFLQALIGQHCSALYLHHPSGNSKGKGITGAGGNQNVNQIPYAVHQLSPEPASEGQPPCVRWSVHKLRGYQSREFLYRLTDEGLRVSQGDVITNCGDAVLITIADLEALGTASTSAQIKNMLNTIKPKTIQNNLTRLRERSHVKKSGSTWHLTHRGKLYLDRLLNP